MTIFSPAQIKNLKESILEDVKECLQEADFDPETAAPSDRDVHNALIWTIETTLENEDLSKTDHENAIEILYDAISESEIDDIIQELTDEYMDSLEYCNHSLRYHGLSERDFC